MSENNRQIRGEVSELEVATYLIEEHRCRVSQTFGHSHPYDLVVDADGDLLKIQVKTVSPLQGNQVGRVLNNPDRYTPENVDLFAGQSKSDQEPFFVPCQEVDLEAGNPSIHVTYTPLENMPTKRTREDAFHISDYRFEDALKRWREGDFIDRKM